MSGTAGGTLFLVDGSFELFRCFFGGQRARRADGQEVGAVRTLFAATAALLNRPSLTHVAIAFDEVGVLEAREPEDTALIQAQYDLAHEVARALGIEVWSMSGFSADDALATAARRFEPDPALQRIVICSSDNDFAQCVRGDRVVLFNRIRNSMVDEARVLERFGVAPERIPEWLALVGDKSDGIPGIPGFGAKAAAAVIRRFGRMEDIPLERAGWEGVEARGLDRLAQTFAERRAEAISYRDRSIKRLDAPVADELDSLRWRGAVAARRAALAECLEDPGVLDRRLRDAGG